ncbi:DUF4406 domain-containing protein [Paraburkholderia phymatum]|uniref:DUF4406 domain-containing protein n=1 Tax=Paraburkholderia phymatum TaxID=148447 RepID=UPI003177DC3E
MRLYIAGPMTGYPELNFPAFHAEAARLRALGFEIVNPAEINADPNAEWLDCMRADIKQLVDCDGIALLPGWEQSRGASIEQGIARDLGLVVFRAYTIVARAADMPVLSGDVLCAGLLENDAAVLTNVDELVATPAMRTEDVDAEVVDTDLLRIEGEFKVAANA